MGLLDRIRRRDEDRIEPPVVDLIEEPPAPDPMGAAPGAFDHHLDEVDLDTVQVIDRATRHRFAEHLIQMGVITRPIAAIALAEAKVTKEKIGEILVRNNYMRRSQLVDILSHYDPQSLADGQIARVRIPSYELKRHTTMISAETDERLFVSTLQDETVIESLLKPYYPDREIIFTAFNPDRAMQFYERLARADKPVEDEVIPDHEKLHRLILMPAMMANASDVHVLPRSMTYSVFVRVLGDLRHIHEGNLDEYKVVATQLKSRARMDISQKRLGQDGQISIDFDGKAVDMRVATVPVLDGEAIVVRILDGDRVDPKLDKLGITALDAWRRGTSRKSGLCIITGETGSGKTTTLRSTLSEFDRLKRRIWTVEDPVEYKIPFTGQVSINSLIGRDYKTMTRNFMRADGDVLVIGEIRDEETARNAIKAAETGHLVIATLHNDSITSSILRLQNLGIDPIQLRYMLRSILVQTLVRCICPTCHGTGVVDASSCPRCLGDGYASQTVASECVYLPDTDAVDHVIALANGERPSTEIRWTPVIDDAIDKMTDGQTTIEELRQIWGVEVEDRCRERGIDFNVFTIPADGH